MLIKVIKYQWKCQHWQLYETQPLKMNRTVHQTNHYNNNCAVLAIIAVQFIETS